MNENGYIEVIRNGYDYAMQRYTVYRNHQVYVREYILGVWSDWGKFAMNADLNASMLPRGDFSGDANTLKTPGTYRASAGATNVPSANGFLIVFTASSDNIFQIACDYSGNLFKHRTYWHGIWYEWK